MLCNIYTLNSLHFCRKFVFKKCTVKKIKLTLSDDELNLMFLHKKRKKLRFWVYFFIFQEKTPGRIWFDPRVEAVLRKTKLECVLYI